MSEKNGNVQCLDWISNGRAEVGSLVVFHTNSNRLVIGRMDEKG